MPCKCEGCPSADYLLQANGFCTKCNAKEMGKDAGNFETGAVSFSGTDASPAVQLFDELDKDGDGELTRQELLDGLGKKQGMSSAQVDALRKAIDTDGDSKISREEWKKAWERSASNLAAEVAEHEKTREAGDKFEMSGYLWKGKSKKGVMAKLSMRKRYFRVKEHNGQYEALYYKPDENGAKVDLTSPKGVIYLREIRMRAPLEDVDGKYGFSLVMASRTYYLWAEAREDKERWCKAFDQLGVKSQGP